MCNYRVSLLIFSIYWWLLSVGEKTDSHGLPSPCWQNLTLILDVFVSSQKQKLLIHLHIKGEVAVRLRHGSEILIRNVVIAQKYNYRDEISFSNVFEKEWQLWNRTVVEALWSAALSLVVLYCVCIHMAF